MRDQPEQPEFIFDNGRLKKNPNYHAAQDPLQKPSTIMYPQKALTMVSTPEQMMVAQDLTGQPTPQVVETAFVTLQSQVYGAQFQTPAPLGNKVCFRGLSTVFRQNEIPIGLVSKLLALQKPTREQPQGFDALHFCIDDSGSMDSASSLHFRNASFYMQQLIRQDRHFTRWEDAEDRLHILIADLLTYVPAGPIILTFLNSKDRITLDHTGKTPEQFSGEVHQTIRAAFTRNRPTNGTPLLRNIYTMLGEGAGRRVMNYVLTDGEPNGGTSEVDQIKNLLVNRRNPENSPLTFVCCSNDPRHTEWMHEVEEVACAPVLGRPLGFVAALKNFPDEQRDVQKDQGQSFPYTRGLWLLASLVAAINPNDLDALDQHAPLTKFTIDNLIGRVLTPQEYQYYFDHHPNARRVFGPDYDAFCCAGVAIDIPSVRLFEETLAGRLSQDMNNGDDNSEAREEQYSEQVVIDARRRGGVAAWQPTNVVNMQNGYSPAPVQYPAAMQGAYNPQQPAAQAQQLPPQPLGYSNQPVLGVPVYPGQAANTANVWGGNPPQRNSGQSVKNPDKDCALM